VWFVLVPFALGKKTAVKVIDCRENDMSEVFETEGMALS